MLDNLAVGDKVVTIGGIKGKIIKIKDNNIRLRVSSNVDIDFIKNAISRVTEKNSDNKQEEIEEKE
jgi:preprotein translocase subunit YajC